MFDFRPWCRALLAGVLAGAGSLCWPAPPLTTIQDVLYRADGKKFQGIAEIEWKGFQTPDGSNIAAQSITVQIVDGVLKVQLTPTTNATPASYYTVRYNSNGKIQFTETWAVPPSTTPLRISGVRVAAPAGGGLPPGGVTGSIPISDVVGLSAELAARPTMGATYTPSRVAMIAADGSLESVVGDVGDCVRVNGSTGPCGGATGGPGFADAETPAGVVNGSNATFTLAAAPAPAASLQLYRNGVLQKVAVDFSLAANAVTFLSGAIPQVGDVLSASYRLAGGAAAGQVLASEVLCSRTGASTSLTALTSLALCTVPAGHLQAGDRVGIHYDYFHQGSATGFTFEVRWGNSVLVSRSAPASETVVTGRSEAGIHVAGAQWGGQSWGGSLALAASAGVAADALSAPLLIDGLARMDQAGSDTVILRSFTVVRYPAR